MIIKGRYMLILLGGFCAVYLIRLQLKLNLNLKEGDLVRIKTILSQEPILKDNKQTFIIKGIKVQTGIFPEYHYGNNLTITGNLKKQMTNSPLNQFVLINPAITLASSDSNKFYPVRQIYKLRQKLVIIYQQVLPEPEASLLMGIVLGVQSSLPSQFYNALKNTGTIHIIVASGMNLTLLAGSMQDLLIKLMARKKALLISSIIIILYCILTGLNPPIVRAGIMALLLYWSVLTGREFIGWLALLVSAIIMLLINPLLILDIGFQLSFSATSGLIFLTPKLEKKLKFVGSGIRGQLAQTLAAQIFTLPLLVVYFGNVNLLAVIPNLFVLWLIPYVMDLGFLIGLAGLIWYPLASFLGWLIFIPLTYFVKIINFFSQFKMFNLNIHSLSWLAGIGYYLILASILIYYSKRDQPFDKAQG